MADQICEFCRKVIKDGETITVVNFCGLQVSAHWLCIPTEKPNLDE